MLADCWMTAVLGEGTEVVNAVMGELVSWVTGKEGMECVDESVGEWVSDGLVG